MARTLAAEPSMARAMVDIERLKFKSLWRALWSQSPALWFIQLYLFFEYVRPQTIYPWLDIAPWSQITLGGAVLGCLLEGRIQLTSQKLWLGVFALTTVIVLSALTAYSSTASLDNWSIWVNWLLLMLVVGAGIKNRKELLLLLIAFGLWNLKMSQHGVKGWVSIGFSFRAIGIGGAPGWFQNSGEFGIEMCIFLPLCAYYAYGVWPRLSKFAKLFLLAVAGSALFSIVASSSRGALVGAAVIGIWALWRNPNRGRAFVFIAVVAPIVWLSVPQESKARFDNIGEDQSSVNRLTYWKHGVQIANQHPILGIGYKNWMPYYTSVYNRKGQLPHNFMIEAIAELGYTGGALVLALIALTFAETSKVRNRTKKESKNPDRLLWAIAFGLDGAMIGFVVSGSFVSVLYYPFLWMNIAMVMALVRVEASRAARASAVGAHRAGSWDPSRGSETRAPAVAIMGSVIS